MSIFTNDGNKEDNAHWTETHFYRVFQIEIYSKTKYILFVDANTIFLYTTYLYTIK